MGPIPSTRPNSESVPVKQVLLRDGQAVIEVVPDPLPSEGQVMIRTHWSVLSSGTERSVLDATGKSLLGNAVSRPEQLKKVIDTARRDGYWRTYNRVQGMLKSGLVTGYSSAGEVVQVGSGILDISVGDLVAAAGAGYANHAEFATVPRNLVCLVPRGVTSRDASTATLGSIALQGVRRSEPTLGETFAVVGLGVLGLITVQLLKASGCDVIGIDPDERRRSIGLLCGATNVFDPKDQSLVQHVSSTTRHHGVDAAIVTASSKSNEVVSQAMQLTRKRGRIIIVGDVGLGIQRRDMYEKELDLLMSTSYGPGRYDMNYEELGIDYPLPYVRWTENRNMQAYLEAVAKGSVNLDLIPAEVFSVDRAEEAYAKLNEENPQGLLNFLEFDTHSQQEASSIKIEAKSRRAVSRKRVNVALVGGSSFAQAVHLPNLVSLKSSVNLHTVVSRTPTTALSVAKRFGAERATTDLMQALDDPEVDLVLIATRHNLHGEMVKMSLEAGKNVLVEKPLTLDPTDLTWFENFFSGDQVRPMLSVGYNRRFSPAAQLLRQKIEKSVGPTMMNYVVNAGRLESNHWTKGSEGGGRNLGEACHMYDLLVYLASSSLAIQNPIAAMSSLSEGDPPSDNFTASIRFDNGDIGQLMYTSEGNKKFAKESLTVFSNDDVIVLDDFESMRSWGENAVLWKSRKPDKGHLALLNSVTNAILQGDDWPIPLHELLLSSAISFQVEELISG